MSYTLLILEPAGQCRERPADGARLACERMLRLTGDLAARGVPLASDALTSDAKGVRRQMGEGRRMLIDGPFTESKEMVWASAAPMRTAARANSQTKEKTESRSLSACGIDGAIDPTEQGA
jgi:hypothetical protein